MWWWWWVESASTAPAARQPSANGPDGALPVDD